MKWTVFILVFYLSQVILGGVMEGTGGLAATYLVTTVDADDTTFTVATTEGFLQSDVLFIGAEQIRYTNKTQTTFTIPALDGRGYNGTKTSSHGVGARVYSEGMNVGNSMLGYNIAATGANVGIKELGDIAFSFFRYTLPKLVTWNFPQFQVNPYLQYIRIMLALGIGAAFVFWTILQIIGAFGGVMRSIWLR